jgi:hypothetical protein
MRRIALAVVAAGVLLTASRSAAQTEYPLTAFTFSPATSTLVGTVGDPLGDDFFTVTLTLNANTIFAPTDPYQPQDPFFPPNPFRGLFTAWNGLIEFLPPNPIYPPNPYAGLLVALGQVGSWALVTATEDGTLLSFEPVAPQ